MVVIFGVLSATFRNLAALENAADHLPLRTGKFFFLA